MLIYYLLKLTTTWCEIDFSFAFGRPGTYVLKWSRSRSIFGTTEWRTLHVIWKAVPLRHKRMLDATFETSLGVTWTLLAVPLSFPPTSKVVLLFLLSRWIPYLVSADVGKNQFRHRVCRKRLPSSYSFWRQWPVTNCKISLLALPFWYIFK